MVVWTAGIQKVFSPDPQLGFLAHAATLAGSAAPDAARRIFNDRLDAGVALLFLGVVSLLVVTSVREWWLVLSGRKAAATRETPFTETAYVAGD